MTDEEIAEKIKKGESELYGEIIDRYRTPLERYAKLVTNWQELQVEDIVEESLVSAYVNIKGFEKGKKFSSWLYRIVHNKAVDAIKKRKIPTSTLEDKEELIPCSAALNEEILMREEQKSALSRAIKSLDDKYREPVWLYYFEGKNYEDISDILRIPTSNVGVLLYRAKMLLKNYLEKYEGY